VGDLDLAAWGEVDHLHEVRVSLDADDVGVLDGAAEAADAALFTGGARPTRGPEKTP
jgi:hypothetical protein